MIPTDGLLDRLPSPPATAMRVLALCDDPDATIGELTEVISQDPALATRVLIRANSAAYGNAKEVSTLSRAAVLLGFRRLRVTALGFSLVAGLPRDGRVGGIVLAEHWARSVVTASVARRLAAIARPEQVEEAHLCGLLAWTGRVGLAVVDPEAHLAMVERFGPDPGDDVEEECLGIGSTEFGAILLGAWGLPSVYSWAPLMAAGRRPTVEEGPEVALLAPVLELAGVFGRAASDPEHAELVAFREAADELLGLPADDLATVLAGLPTAAAEALGELGIDGDAVRGLVRLLERDAVASAA